MNNVCLIGNMTRDPELRHTPNGKTVTNFTLAVNKPFGDNEPDYIRCQCWGKTAENTAQYCSKGSKVGVTGRLSVRSYEKDGQKRTIAEVVCDRVIFLDSKRGNNDSPFGGEEVDSSDVPF